MDIEQGYYNRGKSQDGRRNNGQNLTQEDRAKGGRNSGKGQNYNNQGYRSGAQDGRRNNGKNQYNKNSNHQYNDASDNDDYDDDNYGNQGNRRNYNRSNKVQDGRRNNGKNQYNKNSNHQYNDASDNDDYDNDNYGNQGQRNYNRSNKVQDGRRNNGQNLSQEDRARGGRNSGKSQNYNNNYNNNGGYNQSYGGNQNSQVKVRSRELDDLLEDASHFLEQPIPSKAEEHFHYDDDETDQFVSGSEIEGSEDEAAVGYQKKAYTTEYERQKNRQGGKQNQYQGQDG